MITLIRNRIITPERIARSPRKIQGGWVFTHPPNDLWRYNKTSRRQAIKEWTKHGALALASIVGGCPAVFGALANDGPCFIPWPYTGVSTLSVSTTTNDAAGEYVGFVFQAPKSGNIRGFGLYFSSAVGSPVADFKLETVNMTTGFPTGTPVNDGGSKSIKTNVAVTSGWKDSGDFDADATVTRGDLMAVVVRYVSGTSYAVQWPGTNALRMMFPYTVANTGSNGKDLGGAFAVRYSDGTYGFLANSLPFSNTTFSDTWGSGTNPNHRGNVYLNPTPKRCIGGWINYQNAGLDCIIASDSWDGTADNDGTSNLTFAQDVDLRGFSSGLPSFFLSSTSLEMSAGVDYRVIAKPGGSSITAAHMNVNAAAIMDTLQFGQSLISTSANNPSGAGSWTDSGTKRFEMGFWFDQLHDGAGGAGVKVHPGMTGGLGA